MRSVDDSVYAHSLNVALISRAIGKWMQFSKEDLNTLTLAGLLHDIGKTQIPPEILNKQGKLTDEEFDIIRSHAKLGHKILKDTDLDSLYQVGSLTNITNVMTDPVIHAVWNPMKSILLLPSLPSLMYMMP